MASSDDMDAIVCLSEAIGALARGDTTRARTIVGGLAGWAVRDTQQTLPGLPPPMPALDAAQARRGVAERLFAYWRERCGHPAAKATPERIAAIGARLRDGYTEPEIRKAIDGAASSAYVDKETGRRYDDLTLVCRNGAKLEDFVARGVAATGDIPASAVAGSPVEDQISELRRRMSDMRKQGRSTEYEAAARDLEQLMTKRKAS